MRAAWQRAQEIGQYHFTSELAQTTHPGPALVNVGRSSETDVLYMEGEANLPADQLHLTLWDHEGSAFNPQDAVEVRIAGDKAEGRVAGGPWQAIPEFSDAFAPGRDLMGYLAGMRNVRDLGVETRELETNAGRQAAAYHRYAFEVDGPDFAAYMRDQMERHLIEHGKLPAGMSLSLSDTYLDLTGEGEVWLDSQGLPRRIHMHMVYPEVSNGDWVEATITNDFYGYPSALAASPLARVGAMLNLPTSSAGWQRLLVQTGLMIGSLGLLLLLVTMGRSRGVYAGFAIAMVVAMVITPLLQQHHVYAFNTEQAEKQAEQETAQEEAEARREYETELYVSDWNPQVNPLEAAAASQALIHEFDLPTSSDTSALQFALLDINPSPDCNPNSDDDPDGDGLSDKVEAQLGTMCSDPDSDDDGLNDGIEVTALGTDPLDLDSDGDKLYDTVEVEGFEYNVQRWYSDPLNADTNKDGQSDALECPERMNSLWPTQVCRDTDGDGTPDIFDDDNDGDGVPDWVDISPQTQQGAFDLDNPFTFKIDTDARGIGKPIIVDVQLRPTNPAHLTYARNVLDWPAGDEAGQLQRQRDNHSTFADLPDYPGGDPSAANGDMRLIPMLEVRMAGRPLPFPMTTPSATLTLRDSEQTLPGHLILQHSADNQIRFTFTESALTYSFKVYEGVCGQRDRRETRAIPNVQGSYTLSGPRLTDFANGARSLDVTHGDNTVCVTVPDIPNGSYTDQMIDEAALAEYGMMVQDTNDNGRVIVYAPLNVVPDSTGGGRVAFMTRLFYQQFADTWGDQHQARVVWLVQVLSDSCKPVPDNLKGKPAAAKWCDSQANWVLNQTQVIHTYTDEWTLTGMTVREDHGLDVAIVYPDPATSGDSLLNEHLWQVAAGLESSFLTGRSQDGVHRDITIAEIARRFDYESAATEVERWGVPNTALRVQRHTFANLDEIVTLATTHSRAVLDTFSHDKTPTLLVARESNTRNANIDDQWDSNSSTLQVAGNVHTVASFQWTPYRYLDGDGWQPYPLDVYMDQLGAAMKPFFEALGGDYYDPDDPDVLRGAILASQMYGLALVNGVSARIPDDLKEESPASAEDSVIYKATTGAGSAICSVTEKIVVTLVEFQLGRAPGSTSFLKDALKKIGEGIGKGVKTLKGWWQTFSKMAKWKKGLVIAAAVIAVVALIGIAVGVGLFIGLSPNQIAAATKVVNIGLAIINVVSNLVTVVTTIIKAVKNGVSAVATAANAAPVVGLIVSTVLAIGVFAVQMGILIAMGQWSVTAMLSGIADLLAATGMAVLMMLLAFTGVGAIILAVIGLIDALIAAVCAALPQEWTEAAQDAVDFYAGGVVDICGGITGTLTKMLKANMYSNVSIVTFDDPKRLAFTAFNPHPADPMSGFTPGQRLQVDMSLRNALNLTGVGLRLANSWMTMVYFWQYNLAMLRYSSFKYVLSPTSHDVHGDLAFNAHYEDWFDLQTGSHAVGADFVNFAPGKWAITRTLSTDLPISETGLNRTFDLYLLEGYAIPHQECVGIPTPVGIIIPVCWMRPEWGSRPLPLSESLVFDVFPATLTEFYQLRPEEGGYALAWDNHLRLSFPRLRDADGDGLTYESDPNDSRWDTDGDGLNDYFETQQGLSPTSSDSDGDGLSDREELLHETDPFRRDTDGDGLTDKEEVEGWEFVYDFNGGDPKTTWVTSDPLAYDTDGDGIPDGMEKIYGFNPRVWSDPKLLDFESEVYERDAPRLLLRFEDDGSAASFADTSGYSHAATCSGSGCPALELLGYHGYARAFDGVDDALHVSADVLNDLTGGTMAAWVYLDSNTEETLFAKQHDGVNSYGVLSVGYTPTQIGDAGRVYFHAKNGASLLQSNTLLQTGQWYHVAVTFDAGGACMHVNGAREGCVGGDHTIPDDTNVTATTLGAHLGSAGGRYLDGRLDEFAIFPYVLGVSEIQTVITGTYTYEDGFVRPGAALNYEGTVTNELNGRYAEGLHYGDFPAAVQAPAPRNFTLQPRASTTLAGTFQVNADAATQRLALTQVAGARITDPHAESGQAQLQLHFDDAAGATTFRDTSGFPERPGTCSGGACPTADPEGRYGAAFSFDGNDDVTVPYAAALNNTSFTVAAWAKVTGGSGYRSVLTSREGTPPRGYMLYATPSNTWELWVGNGSDWVSLNGGAIAANAWTHLAGVYNATTQTLIFYVNGKEAARQSGVTFAPNTQFPLRIGAGATEGDPQFHFTGLIDEVHVYEDARDAGQINQLFQAPVLWWKAATPLVENSLFQHETGCRWSCPNSEGRFSSSDGHIWFTGRNNSALDLSDGHFTVSAWVKPEVSGNEGLDGSNQAIVGYDNADAQGNRYTNVTLMRRGNSLTVVTRFNAPTGETGYVTFPNVFTRDRWHHIVVTSSPSSAGGYDITLYVDNVYHSTGNVTLPPNSRGLFIRRAITYKTYIFNYLFISEQHDSDGGAQDQYELQAWWNPGSRWETLKTVYGTHNNTAPKEYLELNVSRLAGSHLYTKFRLIERDGTPDVPDDVFVERWMTVDSSLAQAPYTFGTPFDKWYQRGLGIWDGAKGDMQVTVQQNSVPFVGAISEVAIYKNTFDAESVDELYRARSGVMELPFDDAPGRTAFRDMTGYADARCQGATCPVSGVRGRVDSAVRFDGVDDVIKLGNDSRFNLPGAFTFSAWLYPTGSGSGGAEGGVLINKEAAYQIARFEDGTIRWAFANTDPGWNWTDTGCTAPLNTWTHIAVTYDHGAVVTYKNGASCHTYAGSGVIAPANQEVWLGGRGWADQYFAGLLDEVGLYREAYTAAQVAELYRQAPQFNLPMDENSGATTFTDVAGGQNGTCSGNACPQSEAKGQVGLAASFDGVDDALYVPANALNNLGAGTIAAWVYLNSAEEETFFAKQHDGVNAYGVLSVGYTPRQAGETGRVYFHAQNDAPLLQSSATLPTGQWYHVAVTFDGASATLYINGEKDAAITGSAGLSIPNDSNPTATTLGAHLGTAGGRYLDGRLDEFAIYHRALSGLEIKRLYTAQAAWVEERQTAEMVVDADAPTAWLVSDTPYRANRDAVLHIGAQDPATVDSVPASGVDRVIWRVNGGAWREAPPCRDAEPGAAWCPTFDPTVLGGEGAHTIETYAIDRVDNRSTVASHAIYVDATPPLVSTGIVNGALLPLSPHPTEARAWAVTLSGSVSDPNLSSGGVAGSGVSAVQITLLDANGAQVGEPVLATVHGNVWSVAYPLDDAEPTGDYTLRVVAGDRVGNSATYDLAAFHVDGSAPSATLDASTLPTTTLTSGALHGVVSEAPVIEGVRMHLMFEEAVGATSFADSSGQHNAAGCSGNGCPVAAQDGQIGSALAFDGVDDALRIENFGDFDTASVSAWVYRTGETDGRQALVSYKAYSACGFALLLNEGNRGHQPGFLVNVDGTWQYVEDTASVPLNTWVHLAATYNGAALQLYRDGVLVAELDAPGNLQQCTELTGIGAQPYGDMHFFPGRLDDVRIFGHGLISDDVARLAQRPVGGVDKVEVAFTPTTPGSPFYNEGMPVGQVLHLPLDDQPNKEGNIVFRNIAAPAHQGSCQGAGCPTSGMPGQRGTAASFDGVNDAIRVENLGDFTTASASAWVYRTHDATWREALISYKSHSNCGFILSLNEDGQNHYPRIWVKINGTWQYAEQPVSVPLHTWAHLAATYDGDTLRLYRDGALAAEQAAPGGMAQCDAPTGIGAQPDGTQVLWGALDDARIFDRALSAAEIKALWRGSDPLLHLTFDDQRVIDSPLRDRSAWGHDGVARSTVNVAVGKTATQSSDYLGQYGAALAVDGNTSGDFQAGSVTHTNNEYRPWWQVDLGASYNIATLALWNRTDGSSERLSDFYVFVSDAPFVSGDLDAVRNQPDVWEYYHAGPVGAKIELPVNRTGRYARVQLAGSNFLSLAEVQVWAGETKPPLRTVPGRVGNGALALDGGNDYVALPPTVLNDLGAGTLVTWVYLDANTEETIFAKQHDGVNSYGVLSVGTTPSQAGEAGRVYFHTKNGAPLVQSNATLPTGQWTHLAATFNATGACIYVNGVQDACVAGDHSIPDDLNVTATTLGAHLGTAGGRYLDGTLDDFIIYPRVLSPTEVAVLAQQGWQAASVAQSGAGVTFSEWSAALPAGLEGSYQIDARGSDALGLTDARVQALSQWQGSVDTLAPRISVSAQLIGSGPTAYTNVYITAQDFNLTTDGYIGPCPVANDARVQHEYYTSPWYLALAPEGEQRLYALSTSCQPTGDHRATPVTFCDTAGNCATASAATRALQATTSMPLLDALVLTPTHGSVLTSTAPIAVMGAAYAQDGLETLTVTVDSAVIYTQTWPAGVITGTWTTTWTLPTGGGSGEGAYRLEALLRDQNGIVLTATHPITVIVDTQAPEIAIASTVLTSTHYQPSGILALHGPITDTGGIADVEWRVANGAWQAAQVSNGGWQGLWQVGFEDLPDGETFTVAARATDVAGRAIETTANVVVDLVGPEAVTLTQTSDAASLTLDWTESSDPSGLLPYELHWTTQLTATPHTLITSHPAGSGGSVTRPAVEGSKVSFRLGSRDSYGNVTWQTLGPVYVETAFTPDYVTPDEDGWQRGWMESACAQLGTDARIRDRAMGGSAINTAQHLYASWNSDGLRLTWTGANWRTEGDLFVYLDTQPGGSTRAYNPYVETISNTTILLPNLTPITQTRAVQTTRATLRNTGADGNAMGADYLVWMQDPDIATLMHWNIISGTWEAVTETWDYHFEQLEVSSITDLYLPFDTLGISHPATTSLSLAAFATEEHALRLWATMPPRNPVNSAKLLDAIQPGDIQRFALLQAYTWPSLGSGICPNGAQAPPINIRASSIDQLTQAARQSTLQPARQFTGADVRWTMDAAPAGIAYSVLEDNLFNIMDDVFADMTDWDAVDAELCALNPDDPECERQDTPKSDVTLRATTTQASRLSTRMTPQPALSVSALMAARQVQQTSGGGLDFNAQDGLAAIQDVSHPAVGHGQSVTYTIRYVNRGVLTSTGLTADIVTWGPVRLLESEGAVYASEGEGDNLTEWYSLILPLGELGPSEALTATFTGVIDLDFDPTNQNGWATVDVIFYDDTGSWDTNQLDWFYIDHEVDDEAPSLGVFALPGLIGPGENTLRGTASDQSAVPTITLAIVDPLDNETWWDCSDPTPEDGAWTCAWDAGGAAEGDIFYLGAQATDAFGQVGRWSPSDSTWYDFTVDATPPTLTLNAATQAALADGVIGPDEMLFGGGLSDNRLVKAVEVCDDNACDIIPVIMDTGTVSSTVYTYDDVPETPLPIDASTPCVGGSLIVRTFDVAEAFTVGEVALGLNLTHTYRYDLEAWLIAPSGAWANVLWNGTDADNYDVMLRDSSTALLRQDKQDHDTGAPYFDYERRPDDPLSIFYGEPAQGKWQLQICDFFPEEDDGAYHRSRLEFTTYELPEATQGAWNYDLPAPEAADMLSRTLTLTGLDSVGNRSAPVTLTFTVDNVAPVFTVTQVLPEVAQALTMTVATGEVTDAGGVSSLYAVGETARGYRFVTPLVADAAGNWRFDLPGVLPGTLTYWLHAEDSVGNARISGPYTTNVLAPPTVFKSVSPDEVQPGGIVTYTLTLENPNPDHAVTGLVITDVLPAEVTPLAPLGSAYLPPVDNTLIWQDLTIAANSSYTLAFTALLSDSTDLVGAYVVNTAIYSSDLGGGVTSEAGFMIASQSPIYFVHPTAGQTFTAADNVSVTIPITVGTRSLTLPDDGYWDLWLDGARVISQTRTYTSSLTLTVGTHALSATLYTWEETWMGRDEITVYVIPAQREHTIYLPLVMKLYAP
ncbi:MAG: LamG-like jellyroll fold domain-containing protein [Anaerolineae bacterium]